MIAFLGLALLVLLVITAFLVAGAHFGQKSPGYKNWPKVLSLNPTGLLEAFRRVRVK
jgi:hypothetical protein